MKTISRSAAVGLLAAFAFSSCASDPYYQGGAYDASNAVPAIATGVAIAALAGYANERASRKRHQDWAYYRYATPCPRPFPGRRRCHR